MIDSISKSAIKAGIGYSVGNILIRGIGFVSLPIFARLLTVSDFGIVNVFQSYVSIWFVIIGFALHSSLRNARIDFPDQLRSYTSSLTLFVILSLVCFFCVGVIFQNWFADILLLTPHYLVFFMILESFCMAMITFYNGVISIDYRYKEYIKISFAYSACGILLGIVFILTWFSDMRYLGRIYGTFIGGMLVTSYILYRIFSKARPQVNFDYWKYGLSISLPIIPHGLSQIVLSSFDRILIKSIIGSVEAGLYSFAFNIGAIFSSIATSLDTAWSQWFFDQMKEKNYMKIRNAANIYGVIVLVGAMCLMLISPELVIVLGGCKYKDSCTIVPLVILAMFLSYMYYFPAVVEYYYKKTKLIMIGTILAAVVNIGLNSLLIPRYGYKVAAMVTVLCYLFYYLLHVNFSRLVHGNSLYDLKWHFGLVLVAFFVAWFVFITIDLWILRYAIIMVLLAVSVFLGIKRYAVLKNMWFEFRH